MTPADIIERYRAGTSKEFLAGLATTPKLCESWRGNLRQ
jgi:hypothetical protein